MYKKLPVNKLTGDESFTHTGDKRFTVLEFWQYGFSCLNSNVLRGALAEFIVENALKQNSEIDIRSPWRDYDVLYTNKKIEVKSYSYIQDWDQNQFSRIVWSGLKAKMLYWSSAVNGKVLEEKVPDYKSDIYVLALLMHQDPATLDLLDLDQWCFYVLSKKQLREVSGDRSSVSLSCLEKHSIPALSFQEMGQKIRAL